MSRILWSTAAAAIVASTLSLAGSVQPASAEQVYPWCALYGGRNSAGVPSCGSTTYAQCMATVSGSQGTCIRNPFYEEPPVAARRPKRSS